MSEPLDQIQPPDPRGKRRFSPGNLLLWLLLVPGVFGVLVFFSYLALVLNLEDLAANTRSMLQAQYLPWPYDEIPPINIEALINDIQHDVQLFGTPEPEPTLEIGEFLRPPTAEATDSTAPTDIPSTPIPVNTPTTAADTPTRAVPTQTRTIGITATLQASSTTSPSPTATNSPTFRPPLPTFTYTSEPEEKTPTKTPTKTPIPPTQTVPPTQTTVPPTQTVPPTAIVTEENTPVPTENPTTPPTPAPAPVRPIAENNGQSVVDPDGQGCLAYFGYRNDNPMEIDIPIGDRNNLSETPVRIAPGPEQPTHFYTDRVSPAFEVVWNSGNPFIWTLDGRQAIAQWCNPP